MATHTGTGPQALRWKARDGAWRAVVMNADAARGVTAELSIGVRLPHLVRIALGAVAAGVTLLATGLALLCFSTRPRRC